MKHVIEMEASQALVAAHDDALGGLAALLDRSEQRSDFWSVIHEVIVAEARFMRGDRPLEVALSEGGIICDPFRLRILERLLADPDKSEGLLRQVVSDIAGFLAASCRLEGSWGSATLFGTDLLLRLTARENVASEPSRARILKIDLSEEGDGRDQVRSGQAGGRNEWSADAGKRVYRNLGCPVLSG